MGEINIGLLEKLEFIAIGEKEDIKELEKFKADTTEIIRNLINKYKEQERDIRDSHILIAKYSKKNEEQEKIIELMAEKLVIYKFEEIICMETECEHIELQNEGKCIGDKECILDYFKKKARENNEP